MANFVGKIDLDSLVGFSVADIETEVGIEKCIVIPIKANNITYWKCHWQLWFRAISYRNRLSRFTHFIMHFVPKKDIKKLSAAQLEALAQKSIGGMFKTKMSDTENNETEIDADTFIKNNI